VKTEEQLETVIGNLAERLLSFESRFDDLKKILIESGHTASEANEKLMMTCAGFCQAIMLISWVIDDRPMQYAKFANENAKHIGKITKTDITEDDVSNSVYQFTRFTEMLDECLND
jgi:hypothetical protein